VNIISSAIVNKPPPAAVANLLARRNKIHHLDHDTDETLMTFFDKDPGSENKTSNANKQTMPSRNWAMITENSAHGSSHANGHTNGHVSGPYDNTEKVKDGHSWLHKGEVDAGTKHKAALEAKHGQDADGSLDVCIRVEIDQHDATGKTEPYGMTIPTLSYDGPPLRPTSKRYAGSHRSVGTEKTRPGTAQTSNGHGYAHEGVPAVPQQGGHLVPPTQG
jgi:hypothetical protein